MSGLWRRVYGLRADESGFAVIEALTFVVLFGLMLDFVAYCGENPRVRAQIDKASKAAAQEASVQRSEDSAMRAAAEMATANLSLDGVKCANQKVTLSSMDAASGAPTPWSAGALVRVDVECDVDLSALQRLPLPGAQHVTSSFIAPIDTHKDLT